MAVQWMPKKAIGAFQPELLSIGAIHGIGRAADAAAETHTFTVGTTGDYATLAAWQTARSQISWPGDTERAVLQSEVHASIVLTNWTEGVRIEIVGELAQDGDTATGASFAPTAFGAAISIEDNDYAYDVSVEDVVFDLSGMSQYATIIGLSVTPTVDSSIAFRRTIFYGSATGNNYLFSSTDNVHTGYLTVVLENSIFHDLRPARWDYSGTSSTMLLNYTATACTFDECDFEWFNWGGSSVTDATILFQGCLLNNTTLSATGGTDTTLIDCISSAASNGWDTETNCLFSTTFVDGAPAANQVGWVDSTTLDYRLVDDADNVAVDHLSTAVVPSTDILGDTRDASPNAGAFETVVAVAAGGMTASITASGTITSATLDADGDLAASLTASGTITSATLTDTATEDMTASLTASGTITQATLTADGDLAASLTASGSITSATLTETALEDMTASLTASGTITSATLTADGDLSSSITLDGLLTAAVLDATGDLTASITAVGTLTGALDSTGDLAASLTALGSITSAGLDATGDLAASLTASGVLSASLTDAADNNAMTASITALGSITSAGLDATGDLAASLTALGSITSAGLDATGDLAASLTAVGTLTGALTNGAGSIAASLTAGASLTQAVLTADGALLASLTSVCSLSAALTDAAAPAVVAVPIIVVAPPRTFMKQRIHNALRAAINGGEFFKCIVDPKTGLMTIDPDKLIKPTGVIIKELKTGFSLADHYRRGMNSSEITNWSWAAVVSFNSEASCESFEEQLIVSGIKVPPTVGSTGQRTLLARLADSIYDHPPEQSPANGTVVEFTFEVISPLLRR